MPRKKQVLKGEAIRTKEMVNINSLLMADKNLGGTLENQSHEKKRESNYSKKTNSD